MSAEQGAGHSAPNWFVPPGEGDFYAVVALVFMIGALYLIVVLYAAFDRWAEHQSQGTPLAKTIPTMLAIALLYEIFPLDHFSVFLPLSAILIALMADWSRFHLGVHSTPHDNTANDTGADDATPKEEPAPNV
ncbi:hypothetical protein [Shimia biformata]|uniref:hypothetical protein n=1 Tax=Shimia biformata TaxID=1294299 RepID=UPI001950CB28|nr:hypothetical protein [Shimia biformata]